LDVDSGIPEVLKGIKSYIDANPDKRCYFGFGYDECLFDEKGPHKSLLDEICDDKPVLILSAGGHEGWCNSKSLELAGITAATPDPVPGLHYYERDENGMPTGHLVEVAPVERIIKKIDPFDAPTVKEALKNISRSYAAMGVTSLADMGIFSFLAELSLRISGEMSKTGDLAQRYTGCGMFISDKSEIPGHVKKLEELHSKFDTDLYRINFLKILNDGTVESRSAAMFKPYNEDGAMPDTLLNSDELIDICMDAAKAGLDIHIHAIGDKAINTTLTMAGAVRDAGYSNTRITNAHTELVRHEDRPLFGKYNVIGNTTAVWHYGKPGKFKVIGERIHDLFTMKSLLSCGAKISFGSDFPVDEYGPEPVKGIQMGVTRQMYNDIEAPVLEPLDECLTIEECIKAYTIDAAYQIRMENKLGSIEAGKYADLVVLDKNIFEADVNKIYKTPVAATYIGGKCVYRKP